MQKLDQFLGHALGSRLWVIPANLIDHELADTSKLLKITDRTADMLGITRR